MARVSVSLPAPASRYDDDVDDGREGGSSSSGIIFEERDTDQSEVPKRGSKLLPPLGYEGGRLPIRNVDGGGNKLEVADMCNLPSLHKDLIYDDDRCLIDEIDEIDEKVVRLKSIKGAVSCDEKRVAWRNNEG